MSEKDANSSLVYLPVHNSTLHFEGQYIHAANPSLGINFTVHLYQRDGSNLNDEQSQRIKELLNQAPSQRKHLSHQELEDCSGATPDHLETIIAYFKGFGIQVSNKNLLAKTILFKGKVEQIDKAFRTFLGCYQGANKNTFLAYQGPLLLPENIQKMVSSVSGIYHPVKHEYRVPTKMQASDTAVDTSQGYTAKQLMEAYQFPSNYKGKGQCIGIVELGGVYKKSDIQAYFKMMKMPVPKIIEVGTPIDDGNMLSNSEVTLDIEVVGTVAPAAKLVIYYAHTILDAMKLIIADKKNKPSVVSISWAASEYSYNANQILGLNQVFYQAALLGITVIAASGDHGAFNSKSFLNVSIPSSHPLVIGCGGTNVSLTDNNSIESEVVWNQNNGQIGSGGGFSHLYPIPNYQRAAIARYPYFRGSSRGVPDLAANADSTHGYIVIFNGTKMPIGGTSAATPLIAGLIALINEALGHNLGWINNSLYAFAERGFSQILQGNNGYYPAAPYWNPATGLGSPIGEKLLQLFQEAANSK